MKGPSIRCGFPVDKARKVNKKSIHVERELLKTGTMAPGWRETEQAPLA
jgi:hypothetical protein